jgi:hypothetical protein
MPRLLSLLTALTCLLSAPSANAAWFPSEPIDGPAEIDGLGDADLARDGRGGVVYLKRESGVPQVFLSRLRDGGWAPPEKVSDGAPATQAALAASDGERLAIAWIAGGDVFGRVIEAGGAPGPAAQLSGGGGATDLSLDMGIGGHAYAVWAQTAGANGDVHAARLEGATWQGIGPALDVDAAQPAGAGAMRARVAVSPDGNAAVTWGEGHADGRTHVYARRVTGLTPSAFPQDLTLDVFEGIAAGSADSADIELEDDAGFGWAVFRQDVGGRSRAFARRLLGTRYEPPAAIDGGATAFDPRVDFNGDGLGEAVSGSDVNTVIGSYLDKFDKFNPGSRVDGTGSTEPPRPLVAVSERADAVVAWRAALGDGSVTARARTKQGEGGFAEEVLASKPELGPVFDGGVALSTDRSGNTAVVTLQGTPGARWIASAVYDREPGRPFAVSSANQGRRPELKWKAGSEAWGAPRYEVFIGGRPAGTTEATTFVPRRAFRRGSYSWYVTQTDRRGQVSRSRTNSFRVDPWKPRLSVGVVQRGRGVSVRAHTRDRGSGIKSVEIEWGDGGRTRRSRGSHRYKRGRYVITVRASDWARNVATRRVSVRIRR